VGYDSIALSSNGGRLVTVDSSPTLLVTVWDLTGKKPHVMQRKKLLSAGPYSVSVCPNDENMFALISSERVMKWRLEFCGDVAAMTHTEARVAPSTRITRRGSLLGRRNSMENMLHLDKCVRGHLLFSVPLCLRCNY
jgi:hypothetical protein